MMPFQQEYDAHCAAHGVPDRIELMLCDLNAVLRGKWLPGAGVKKLANGEVRLPLSTYAPNVLGEEVAATGLGLVVGDPDGVVLPIAGSLRQVPWMPGHVVQVQIEMRDDTGAVSALDPRQRLAAVLKRFAAKGMRPVVATELEFYFCQKRDRPDAPPVPPIGAPVAQNFDLAVLQQLEPVLSEITESCQTQGLSVDTLIAEYGPGQFEINFHHTEDVLAAAETALLFRRVVSGVALKHGLEASFMAKPYRDAPGNGMHVHASLLDETGANMFDEEGSAPSALLRYAIGGVLDTMRDFQAVFAPHLNSYRRYTPNSFAPSAPDWGIDNRSAGVRVPAVSGPGARLEHRISGADVNPYLVLAAILGGMARGIDRHCDPGLPLDDAKAAAVVPLTHDWRTSVACFASSEAVADVLGTAYRDIYTAVKEDEIQQITAEITPVEYQSYLSRF